MKTSVHIMIIIVDLLALFVFDRFGHCISVVCAGWNIKDTTGIVGRGYVRMIGDESEVQLSYKIFYFGIFQISQLPTRHPEHFNRTIARTRHAPQ